MDIRYIIKRFVAYFLVLYFAVTINFLIPRLVPGDPIRASLMQLEQAGAHYMDIERVVDRFIKEFGLDQPMHIQYLRYWERILHGDLGPSLTFYPYPCLNIILSAMPWTIGLLSVSTIIAWLIGTFLGTIVAWRGGKASTTLVYIMLVIRQIPYYILGLLLVFVFVYLVPLFPARGVPRGTINLKFIAELIYHSILPALSIVIVSMGRWLISMRSLIINVLESDFLILARAKGLEEGYIRNKYVMRNAIVPQLTGLAMSLGFIVTGSMIVESIFSYPGLGYILSMAISNLDYNLIQAIFLIVVFSVQTATLFVDLVMPILDPRTRHEG